MLSGDSFCNKQDFGGGGVGGRGRYILYVLSTSLFVFRDSMWVSFGGLKIKKFSGMSGLISAQAIYGSAAHQVTTFLAGPGEEKSHNTKTCRYKQKECGKRKQRFASCRSLGRTPLAGQKCQIQPKYLCGQA